MSTRFYRPELDALRFFAFFAVFCDHLPIFPPRYQELANAGSAGVCIFFLLSAYLIVSILLREKESTGTIQIRAFAVRRVLRIWPLYFAMIFSVYVVGRYHPANHLSGHAVLALSVLLGNIYVLQHGWVLGTVNALWSVSVEEQFYLAVPLVARIGGRQGISIICTLAILFAYIALAWLGHTGAYPLIGVWANSFVQFQFFAAGGLIALFLNDKKFLAPVIARIGAIAVSIILLLICYYRFNLHSAIPSTPSQLLIGYLLLLSASVLLFLAVIDIPVHIPAPLVYLGKISFGLYVFHQFWIWLVFSHNNRRVFRILTSHNWIAALSIFLCTVATAMLSYHFFERPILRYKRHFEIIRTRPV